MLITSFLTSLLMGSSIVAAAVVPQAIDESKIILFGVDGRTEVMDKAEFMALHKGNLTAAPGPLKLTDRPLNETIAMEIEAAQLSKRGCKSYSIVRENADQKFLNWDIQMSDILHATDRDATLGVTQGHSVANSIGVSVSFTESLIKNYLSATFGITYTETWTNTYTTAYTFTVPKGKYGVVVSNPWTTRKSGNIDIGCIGVRGQKSTYQADSYESNSYQGLSWVSGTISLCTSNSHSIHYCIGNGYHN
ncbi:6e179179-c950-4f68-a281-0632a012c961-CDS [Sclerotinia trifoliorum]|uniref:6e179179-c950-4f68-a281-0632a012c961-CDS n=1 Tax=Sclerotinia trifoliorum TaxID=28548 RepID=A0A8H2VUS7_9HELO|nr:6e179179-c950-4f68-a281-0632a012c961-CDS [Sclerotinia trifoliorum]